MIHFMTTKVPSCGSLIELNNLNFIGAIILAAALLLAPCVPFVSANAATVNNANRQQQDGDAPPEAEQTLFNKAQSLYTQGRYEQAAGVLQDFLKAYPQSSIADLTLLWLGRSFMELGRLPEAEQIGQRLRTIRDTPFADIYETELQKARRDLARSGKTPAATPNSQLNGGIASSSSTTGIAKNSEIRNTTSPAPVAARPPAAQPTNNATTAQRNPIPVPVLNNNAPSNNVAAKNTNTATTKPAPPQQQQAQLIATVPDASASSTTARTAAATPNVVSRRDRMARQSPRTARNQRPTQAAANNSGNRTASSNAPVAGNQIAVNNSPRAASPTANTLTTAASNTAASAAIPVEPGAPPQSGGLSLIVKQVPALALALRRATEAASPGQVVHLPLTITNTGNKEDQFRLETDLPAEYQPTFSLLQGGNPSAATDTGLPILVTPQLARGASTEVTLNLRVPLTAADGQQRRFIVRAASQSNSQIARISDGSINVIAAALAAASNVSQASVQPGETFMQTITVRNSGSSPAKLTRTNFVFDPDFELVNASPAPTAYDSPSRTAIWLLGDLKSHESRDINITLRAMPEALAASNSLGRGTVSTQSLPVGSNFDSPSIAIGKVPRARVDSVSVGLTATPGDTMYIPFVVRNPGNSIDSYDLKLSAPGAPPATIYADSNGDGKHQDNEPAITQATGVAPQDGEYPLLLRVQIPASAPDRQQYSYNIVVRSLTSNRVASEANTVLAVATPRVRVRTEQVSEASAPGDAIYYRLVLVNEGSGLAKNLVVTETLPDALQFAGSEPGLNPQDAPGSAHGFQWRVAELAPGDTSVLRIAVRLRPNLSANTNLTTSHSLIYKDSNGNGYVAQ